MHPTVDRRRFLQAASLAAALPLVGCRWREDPMPIVASGRVERLAAFPSKHVDARNVDVWLPAGDDGRTPRPVLYMHDGQAVFDGAMALSRTGWRVDAAIQAVTAGKPELAPMVVAIWNHPTDRHLEFFPQPMLDRLDRAARERAGETLPLTMRAFAGSLVEHGRSKSEAYLRFLVEELKPAIDARFATRTDRDGTFIMGSSMGGLITVNAALSYPKVFGAAASMSTHWIGLLERNDEISDAAVAWLREALPAPGDGLRLYMDRGTTEMDAAYAHAQAQVDALFRERGFGPPQVVSRVFDGAGHNEADWARRLAGPIGFLVTPAASAVAPPTA